MLSEFSLSVNCPASLACHVQSITGEDRGEKLKPLCFVETKVTILHKNWFLDFTLIFSVFGFHFICASHRIECHLQMQSCHLNEYESEIFCDSRFAFSLSLHSQIPLITRPDRSRIL